jgi:hypothetical protein
MAIELGDDIEVPDNGGWIRVRVLRRGDESEAIEKPSTVPGGPPLKVPVWIVEDLVGPTKGQERMVPNGTIAKTEVA